MTDKVCRGKRIVSRGGGGGGNKKYGNGLRSTVIGPWVTSVITATGGERVSYLLAKSKIFQG